MILQLRSLPTLASLFKDLTLHPHTRRPLPQR